MKRLWKGCLGLALGLAAQRVAAQELEWRPVATPVTAAPNLGVSLRPPEPLEATTALISAADVQPVTFQDPERSLQPIIRAQADIPFLGGAPTLGPVPPPPPPPPPPGAGGGGFGDERYNCGVKAYSNNGGFLDSAGNTIGDMFTVGSRGLFQSDHCYDMFCSPVTNPFYFEDPRSLTEIKPLFIYQKVPNSNYAFQGGDIWFYGLQGRLAITDMFSIVISKLGGMTINPGTETQGVQSSSGFAEVMLGPKFTFLRLDGSKTLLAAGLNFDLAFGSSGVFQDTGNLSLIPYISFGQNFGKSSWGSFNFLNTTGYSFATDNQRTDFLYSSFHLDYDVAGLNKIFPLIELNYFTYTQNGGANQFFGFEGRDLINFGSGGVAGHSELSIAGGFRYKFAEWFQVGFAAEFPLLSQNSLMNYRLGLDLIFRY